MNEFLVALEGEIQRRINHIHTAIPARVLEFDPSTACGTVLPLTKMILSDGTEIEYPQIFEVPFVFPQSAGVCIAFPVKEGDTCLLVFCENAVDRWRGSGTLDSQVKFSLTNAVAIPGLFARPSDLITEATQSNAVVVGAGSTRIKVDSSGITLNGNVRVEGDLTVVGNINTGSITTQVITTGSCNLHDA